MSYGENQLVNAAISRAFALIDYNILYNDIHKQYEFIKQTILADESLTESEKNEAIIMITKAYDGDKINSGQGTKRICENCNQECLATLHCEYCVRNYLKANFSNWKSGNDNIDNLIRECQMKNSKPDRIAEMIPYNNLKNIKYLTKGGCSEIYTAKWINGHFIEWNSKKQQLKRFGSHNVVLKRLENIENANHSWLEEAKSHLIISNKWSDVVQCYGLTQDPSNRDYMLVMNIMNIDLRKYLQQNHNQLTWKERIQIAVYIIDALERIHRTPLEYKNIMKQCWDANPSERLDVETLQEKIRELNIFYQSKSNDQLEENNNNLGKNNNINSLEKYISTSKVYQFENLPEPRNATEEELEVDDFNKLNNQKNNSLSKINTSIFKVSSKKLSKIFKIKPKNDIQNDYKSEIVQPKVKKNDINFNDEDEIYNNPNFHSEEQNELELPDVMLKAVEEL
ncbi:kinase-like domain-containing protein [Rhizophagus clarus]|uniref:Kinase-like domain-containing protein n=1 Tax=Rhizophagus clarus TaxID=94130 RepID=A0A8H3KUE4_9GLOM|nr:kinase-like domain-containing protein [Rhizophagus clarus]